MERKGRYRGRRALDYGFTDIDGAQPRPLTEADV